MVFEEIIRHSPRRRALHSVAEGFSPTARAHTGCISQSPSIAERQAGVTSCRCPLKTLHSYLLRQAVETAPERTLRAGRRGSVHAGGRPAKSRPEAISIAERQAVVTSCRRLLRQAVKTAPERTLRAGRRGSVHAGGRPAKSRPEAISIAERQAV